jgi:gluconate 5-dehydrogenase
MKIFSSKVESLVTGASRGLGRAMASALAEAGATMVLAARDKPSFESGCQFEPPATKADVEAFDHRRQP